MRINKKIKFIILGLLIIFILMSVCSTYDIINKIISRQYIYVQIIDYHNKPHSGVMVGFLYLYDKNLHIYKQLWRKTNSNGMVKFNSDKLNADSKEVDIIILGALSGYKNKLLTNIHLYGQTLRIDIGKYSAPVTVYGKVVNKLKEPIKNVPMSLDITYNKNISDLYSAYKLTYMPPYFFLKNTLAVTDKNGCYKFSRTPCNMGLCVYCQKEYGCIYFNNTFTQIKQLQLKNYIIPLSKIIHLPQPSNRIWLKDKWTYIRKGESFIKLLNDIGVKSEIWTIKPQGEANSQH